MAKNRCRYPELENWWKERLFVRRQFLSKPFGVGKQQWYITRIREMYFYGNAGNNLNKIRGGIEVPYVEIQGWRKAKIRDGFGYIHKKDLRGIMLAMILNDTTAPVLPSAQETAKKAGYQWVQFVSDFGEGLWEMYNAGVARGL